MWWLMEKGTEGGKMGVIYPPGAVVGRAREMPTKQMWRRRWGCEILHADVAAACVQMLQCAVPLASPRRARYVRGAGALPPRPGKLRQVGVAIRGCCCRRHAAASSGLHAQAHLRCISRACRVRGGASVSSVSYCSERRWGRQRAAAEVTSSRWYKVGSAWLSC